MGDARATGGYLDAAGEELGQLGSAGVLGNTAHDLDALLDHVVAVAVVHASQKNRRVLEL